MKDGDETVNTKNTEEAPAAEVAAEVAAAVEEEDWSSFLASDVANTNGFARHETSIISFLDGGINGERPKDLRIECVESLAPTDMMNLSEGKHDATGHRIWMGALFFVEVLVEMMKTKATKNKTTKTKTKRTTETEEIGTKYCLNPLSKMPPSPTMSDMAELFSDRAVLELGCGTGIGGIALLAIFGSSSDSDSDSSKSTRTRTRTMTTAIHSTETGKNHPTPPRPSESNDGRQVSDRVDAGATIEDVGGGPMCFVFTDGDEDALDLCRRNCRLNLSGATLERTDFARLEWGENIPTDLLGIESTSKWTYRHLLSVSSFDTVLATDVLYDVSSIDPLMQTANGLLRIGGFLCLAHVPRASLPHDDDDDDDDDDHRDEHYADGDDENDTEDDDSERQQQQQRQHRGGDRRRRRPRSLRPPVGSAEQLEMYIAHRAERWHGFEWHSKLKARDVLLRANSAADAADDFGLDASTSTSTSTPAATSVPTGGQNHGSQRQRERRRRRQRLEEMADAGAAILMFRKIDDDGDKPTKT